MDDEVDSSDSEEKDVPKDEDKSTMTQIPRECTERLKQEQLVHDKVRQHPQTRRIPTSKCTSIWVPKKVLQAQKGKEQFWLPKTTRPKKTVSTSNCVEKQRPQHRDSNAQGYAYKTANQIIQRWVPKTILRAQGYYQRAAKIWILKANKPRQPRRVNQHGNKTNGNLPRRLLQAPTNGNQNRCRRRK